MVSAESRPGLRLQILTTALWGLLSTRALSWNEAFSRAATFLSAFSVNDTRRPSNGRSRIRADRVFAS
jgi:hypothetical protein